MSSRPSQVEVDAEHIQSLIDGLPDELLREQCEQAKQRGLGSPMFHLNWQQWACKDPGAR